MWHEISGQTENGNFAFENNIIKVNYWNEFGFEQMITYKRENKFLSALLVMQLKQ